jgi:hypothetical protein
LVYADEGSEFQTSGWKGKGNFSNAFRGTFCWHCVGSEQGGSGGRRFLAMGDGVFGPFPVGEWLKGASAVRAGIRVRMSAFASGTEKDGCRIPEENAQLGAEASQEVYDHEK